MKGQYLAVETVFVFGLGLMTTIGVIILFDGFKTGVLDDTKTEQVQLINHQIQNKIGVLKQSDEQATNSKGEYQISLPERISGNEYTIELEKDNLIIRIGSASYKNHIQDLKKYNISGSARGGDVTVFKQESQIKIRGS